MSMRASVFIATSLDGFIARENGDIAWLGADEDHAGEDYGYKAFMDSVDVLVMGRATYDLVATFGSWPYGSKRVIVLTNRVLTNRPLSLPAELAGTVETMSGPVETIAESLAGQGARHLYIDGGKTVQAFLRAGLIGRMIVTRIPILIGSGIPLFGPLPADIRWRHVRTTAFPKGFVQSEYERTDR